LPDLPPALPRGPTINVSSFGGGCYRTYRQHPRGPRHRHLQLRWWLLPDLPPAPPGVSHRHLQLRWWPLPEIPTAPPRGGATIDVFIFGGGHCRKSRQHPLGGPSSTSSTSVVATAGHPANTPHGGHHRPLQHQWWPLPDLPTSPPRGPSSTSSTSVVAAAGLAASTP
jgi:hypothetical protein